MKTKLILALLLLFSGHRLTAQVVDKNLFATPNANSLNRFNNVPVDYFTGTPNIAIPLYTFKSRSLSVPIALSYHAAGVKPSDHASWVGLGWALEAGGAITRTQNDLPDELMDFNFGTGVGYPRGFFYNHGYLSNSNWTSGDSLTVNEDFERNQIGNPNSLQNDYRRDFSPDEFSFHFLGMSGSLFMGQDGIWHLKSKQGLNFAVSTEIGPYALLEPANNPTQTGKNWPSLIHNCLTKFILTAGDGTQYTFGTDTANNLDGVTSEYTYKYFSTPDSNSVEFTRLGSGYSQIGDRCRDGGTVPTTWYLTKIKSTGGDSIIFRYHRDGYQIIDHTVTTGTFTSCPSCNPIQSVTVGAGDDISILDGITLSSITGANGTILFDKSKANVMDYTPLGNPGSPMNLAWNNNDAQGLFVAYANEVFQQNSTGYAASTFMELDSLLINDVNGMRVKSFNFNYSTKATNRLFLTSLLERGSDTASAMPYVFTYNNIAGLDSVPYNTLKVDHWGDYTGIDPCASLFVSGGEPTNIDPFRQTGNAYWLNTTASGGLSTYFNGAFNTAYAANRVAVSTTMQYGILTQIAYPTGGTTQFTWEPNSYSKNVNVASSALSVSVQDLGATTQGGGLRIRQITSQANFNNPPLTLTYYYVRDYTHGNNLSSGVLNSGLPSYVDSSSSANFLYRCWTSDNVFSSRYSINSPVTYSAVTELRSDSSYATYTFSNQDNGYADIPPTNLVGPSFTSIGTLWVQQNMSSLDLERGLLLNEADYARGKVLIRNISNQYDSLSNRFSTGIRRYNYQFKFSLNGVAINYDDGGFVSLSTGPAAYFGDIISPLYFYIEYPYLLSSIETDYDQNGTNPVAKTTSYTYDSYRNRKSETFSSSQGEALIKSYNYAPDTIVGLSTAAQAAKANMLTAAMVGIPLETTATRSGSQTAHTRLDYMNLTNYLLTLPANTFQSSYGQALDSASNYINYDNKGNVVEYRTRDGVTNCLDWDYNQAYPTAKVVNAYNTFQSYIASTPSTSSSNLNWASGSFTRQLANFSTTTSGSITLSGAFTSNPGSDTYIFNYTLSGPVNESGMLCICGSGGNCSGTPGSVTFSNMPPGAYSLAVTPSSSFNIGTLLTYTYPIIAYVPTTSGAKNYFYDGFENNLNLNVTGGTPHTGNFYWGASSYVTSFVPPDNNTYTIEWWNLVSGTWVYNTQTYSQGMSLTGPVDDVRIFPANSLMSSYTYQPLVGITSSIDPKGFTTYYTYDGLGRSATVMDKDKNVLKRYCYNLSGQSQSCSYIAPPAMAAVNGANSTTETFTITFVNQSTNAVYTFSLAPGSAQIAKVPAGTYTITLSPNTFSSSSPNLYQIYTFSQSYYNNVTFGSIAVSGICPINISPAVSISVNGTNTTTESMFLTFTNTTGGQVYNLFLATGWSGGTIGSVPTGTYNVQINPSPSSPSKPNLYKVYTFTQTNYSTVTFGSVNVTGASCPVIVNPN